MAFWHRISKLFVLLQKIFQCLSSFLSLLLSLFLFLSLVKLQNKQMFLGKVLWFLSLKIHQVKSKNILGVNLEGEMAFTPGLTRSGMEKRANTSLSCVERRFNFNIMSNDNLDQTKTYLSFSPFDEVSLLRSLSQKFIHF